MINKTAQALQVARDFIANLADFDATYPPGTRPLNQAAELLLKLDAAFQAEIERISTLEYNSNEICRHFYGQLRERFATLYHAPASEQQEMCQNWESRLYDVMHAEFELRASTGRDEDGQRLGMRNDDTQIGVEFAIDWFKKNMISANEAAASSQEAQEPAATGQPVAWHSIKEAVDDLISCARSVNHAAQHKILVRGDDEPCFWQREEWIEYLLGLADQVERALLAAPQPQAAQTEREAEIRARALEYMKHKPMCAVVGGYDSPCTCGRDEVAAALSHQPVQDGQKGGE